MCLPAVVSVLGCFVALSVEIKIVTCEVRACHLNNVR